MASILIFIFGLALCLQAFVGLTFLISSIQEKEKRATFMGGLQFLGMFILVILFFILNGFEFFDSGAGFGIMVALLIIGVLGFLLFFSRIGANQMALQGTKGFIVGKVKKWDERNIQFSKMMRVLYAMTQMAPPQSDTPQPEASSKGDKLNFSGPKDGAPPDMIEMAMAFTDDQMNAAGLGPLGPAENFGLIDGAGAAPNCAAMNASAAIPMIWCTPDKYAPPISEHRIPMNPEEAAVRVKGFTKNIGADLVGIAKLDQRWIYTHRGVSGLHLQEWGKEFQIDHQYVVVFAEEMSFETLGSAPHTTIVLESMKNYAKGAFIGAQVANYIANMGYSSQANNMAHYDGLMVPLAVDAGLGECGRLGYLISKEFGPRIRLGMVTTDLPMVLDKPVDIGVQHFCKICKKCANTCPSKSIPDDDAKEVNGSIRWKLNDETCFQYWLKVGTDCGICMRVCPWSHDRTFPHKVIVKTVSRNKFSRYLFNWMDDVFYGKKPRPKAPPEWADFKTKLVSKPLTEEELSLFAGTWKLTFDTPMGTESPLLIVRENGSNLEGNMDGKMGQPEIRDVMMDGSTFSYKADVKSPMGKMAIEFSGTIDGDALSGNVYTPMGPSQFSGERQ